MGILGKGGDVLDIPDLQRRGIVKKSREIAKSNIGMIGADTIDLRNMVLPVESESDAFASASASAIAGNVNEPNASPLSFFDSPSVSSTQQTSFFDNSVQQSAPSLSGSSPELDKDFAAMKIRMEDVEFRLDRFIERIDQLESKIGDLLRNVR